jgi:hypothetical protein
LLGLLFVDFVFVFLCLFFMCLLTDSVISHFAGGGKVYVTVSEFCR